MVCILSAVAQAAFLAKNVRGIWFLLYVIGFCEKTEAYGGETFFEQDYSGSVKSRPNRTKALTVGLNLL